MNQGQVPAALATSMTKDKKPFTYLPGGLDFSEIRSPRMAKRLARHQATIAKPNGTPNRNTVVQTQPQPLPPQQQSYYPQQNQASPPPPRSQPQQTQKQSSPDGSRPTFQKQRSISELLSFSEPDSASSPKSTPPVQDPPMYNPYAPKGQPNPPPGPPPPPSPPLYTHQPGPSANPPPPPPPPPPQPLTTPQAPLNFVHSGAKNHKAALVNDAIAALEREKAEKAADMKLPQQHENASHDHSFSNSTFQNGSAYEGENKDDEAKKMSYEQEQKRIREEYENKVKLMRQESLEEQRKRQEQLEFIERQRKAAELEENSLKEFEELKLREIEEIGNVPPSQDTTEPKKPEQPMSSRSWNKVNVSSQDQNNATRNNAQEDHESPKTREQAPILHINGQNPASSVNNKHVHFKNSCDDKDDLQAYPVQLESMDQNEIYPLEEGTGMSSYKLNPRDIYTETLRAKENRKAINEAMERQRASLSPQPAPSPINPIQFKVSNRVQEQENKNQSPRQSLQSPQSLQDANLSKISRGRQCEAKPHQKSPPEQNAVSDVPKQEGVSKGSERTEANKDQEKYRYPNFASAGEGFTVVEAEVSPPPPPVPSFLRQQRERQQLLNKHNPGGRKRDQVQAKDYKLSAGLKDSNAGGINTGGMNQNQGCSDRAANQKPTVEYAWRPKQTEQMMPRRIPIQTQQNNAYVPMPQPEQAAYTFTMPNRGLGTRQNDNHNGQDMTRRTRTPPPFTTRSVPVQSLRRTAATPPPTESHRNHSNFQNPIYNGDPFSAMDDFMQNSFGNQRVSSPHFYNQRNQEQVSQRLSSPRERVIPIKIEGEASSETSNSDNYQRYQTFRPPVSSIFGPRSEPSQSPSMTLLGQLVSENPDAVPTYQVMGQEYSGDQGRYLPKNTRPQSGHGLPPQRSNMYYQTMPFPNNQNDYIDL